MVRIVNILGPFKDMMHRAVPRSSALCLFHLWFPSFEKRIKMQITEDFILTWSQCLSLILSKNTENFNPLRCCSICRLLCFMTVGLGWPRLRTDKGLTGQKCPWSAACVVPHSAATLLPQNWEAKIEDWQRLDRTEISMIHCLCGASFSSNSLSTELRALFCVTTITVRTSCSRLCWFGQVSRKDDDHWWRKI